MVMLALSLVHNTKGIYIRISIWNGFDGNSQLSQKLNNKKLRWDLEVNFTLDITCSIKKRKPETQQLKAKLTFLTLLYNTYSIFVLRHNLHLLPLFEHQTSSESFGLQDSTASATVRNILSCPNMSAKWDKCSLPITNGPGFARINCLYTQKYSQVFVTLQKGILLQLIHFDCLKYIK